MNNQSDNVSQYLRKLRDSLFAKALYRWEERESEFSQIVKENFINAMITIKHKDKDLYDKLMKEFYHELPK